MALGPFTEVLHLLDKVFVNLSADNIVAEAASASSQRALAGRRNKTLGTDCVCFIFWVDIELDLAPFSEIGRITDVRGRYRLVLVVYAGSRGATGRIQSRVIS